MEKKLEYKIIKYYKYKNIYEHLKTKIGHDPARVIINNVYEYDKKKYKNWLPKKIFKLTKAKILQKSHSLFTACFKNFDYGGGILNQDKFKHMCAIEKILKFDKFCYNGIWYEFDSRTKRSKIKYHVNEIEKYIYY